MKIVKLETFTKPYVSFVKITVEDGSIGFGQMSTYHADITAQIFHKQVAPWVLGKEYFDFDDFNSVRSAPCWWKGACEAGNAQSGLLSLLWSTKTWTCMM